MIERINKSNDKIEMKHYINIENDLFDFENKFNIKSYLDKMGKLNPHYKIKPNKKTLLIYPHINSNKNIFPAKNISPYNNLHLNSISSRNSSSKNINTNPNIQQTTPNNNCFLTSLSTKDSNSKHFKTIDPKKSEKDLFDDYLNIYKVIKEIKNKYKIRNSIDVTKDYSLSNKKYEQLVSNTENILKLHKEKNEWDFKKNEDKVKFIMNNKNILKHNVLSNVLNDERVKFVKDNKDHKINLTNLNNVINKDEKLFSNLILSHNRSCKSIEKSKILFEDIRKKIYYYKDYLRYKVQNKEAEIMRIIFDINEIRHYAKFINNFFGRDISMFEKEIYPNFNEKNLELDELIQKVFNIYSAYLEESKEKIDNIIDESDIIYDELQRTENKILQMIKRKDKGIEKLKIQKNKNKKILSEISKKRDNLQNEYDSLMNDYNQLNKGISYNNNNEIESLANDLFTFIIQFFSNETHNETIYMEKKKSEVDLYGVSRLGKLCINILNKKEVFINDIINYIEMKEKEEPILVQNIINETKIQNLYEYHRMKIKMMKMKENLKKIQSIKKSEKINFVLMKAEKPFYIKKEKKIKIDYAKVEENENIELITYQ